MLWGVVFILLCLAPRGFGQSSESEAATQFQQAGISYTAGDYQKAIELYEEIVKKGWVSGPLYYNLANSYFKAGNLGKAVLNYERAQRFIPRDADLASNHQYALSQVKNYSAPAKKLPVKILEGYRNSLTLDEITLLLFFFFFLIEALYFLGLFLRWPRTSWTLTMIVSCLLLFFHGFVFASHMNHQKNWAIVLKVSAARFEPRENATAYFELSKGTKVKILQEEGSWVKIQRLDGKVGWIKREALEEI